MFSILFAIWLAPVPIVWWEPTPFSNVQGTNINIQGTGAKVQTQPLTSGTAASSYCLVPLINK